MIRKSLARNGSVPSLVHAIVGLGLATLSMSAAAQDADVGTEELEGVLVTGSRVSGRTVKDSPAPIDVIGAAELAATNKSDVLDILNTALPSWNTPLRGGTSGHGSMVRAAQLRGLSPNHTLVLVNGKRWHNTALMTAGGLTGQAPVDLALIPSGLISRVEVMRDGASAIYGSDAIAGVINIITDKSGEGGELAIRQGQYFNSQGPTTQANGSLGLSWSDAGHARISAQYTDSGATVTNTPVPTEYLYYFPIGANGRPVLPVTATGAANATNGYLLPAGATADPREATRNNNIQQISGNRAFSLKSISLDAGHEFNERIGLYSFINVSDRSAHAPQNYRPAYRDETVRAIFPDGYAPEDELDEFDYGGTLGAKGTLASQWNWDLSSTYGRDRIRWYMHNDLNPTWGLASQTDFYIGELVYTGWTNNFDVNRSIDVNWLELPLQVAGGLEYRRDTYKRGNGDLQSYTDGGVNVLDGPNVGRDLPRSVGYSQSQPGYHPNDNVDVSRYSRAVYASAALNPTAAWLVDLAVRHEYFEDFGGAVSARLSTRYDFNDRIAVRLTGSNGFQAPVLQGPSFRSSVSSPTFVTHTLATNSVQGRALGAQPLEPEKSRNYTVGLVIQPWQRSSLAVDFYRIDVDGRIAAATTFGEALYPGSGALVSAAGLGANDRVNYLVNAADTRTDGVDITLEQALSLGDIGDLRLTLAANYNHAELRDVASTPLVLAAFNIPLFSEGDKNQLLYLSPKSKEVISAQWSRDRWNAGLRLTHYGELKRFGSPTTVATSGPYAGMTQIPYDIGYSWVTDLDVNFDITPQLTASVSASNLFDVKPDTLPQPLVQPNQYYTYATNGPLSGDGGLYSATVRFRW